MKEQDYQKKISDNLTKEGYFVTNLIKTNRNGIPDLLALKSNEPAMYIECKTLKGVVSDLQAYRLDVFSEFGFNCFVSYGMELKKWIVKEKKDTDLF